MRAAKQVESVPPTVFCGYEVDVGNPLKSWVHLGVGSVGVSLSVRVSVSMGNHWVRWH